MKWLRIVAVLLVLIVLTFALSASRIVRGVLVSSLERELGAKVTVDKVDVSVLRSRAEITGLTLSNPPDFPSAEAVEVRRIFVTYRLASLFTQQVELPVVEVDLARVVMVTRADGQVNFQHMADQKKKATPAAAAGPSPLDEALAEMTPDTKDAPKKKERKAKAQKQVHIGRLVMKVGEVETRDFSRSSDEPRVRTYRLNLEREYEDVTDFETIGMDLGLAFGLAVGPQMIQDAMEDSGVTLDDLGETIRSHDGDLKELGKKLDGQTKDLQRSLRKILKPPKD